MSDPIGPANDAFIRLAFQWAGTRGGTAVVGWGVHGDFMGRDKIVADIARQVDVPLYCLGTTKAGHPRHPLYIPDSQGLVPWPI